MVEIFTGHERGEKLMNLGRRRGKWLKLVYSFRGQVSEICTTWNF